MQEVTLSIPIDLLNELEALASRQNMSIDELIVTLLKQASISNDRHAIDRLLLHNKNFSIDTSSVEWKRQDIYDRNIFHNQKEP